VIALGHRKLAQAIAKMRQEPAATPARPAGEAAGGGFRRRVRRPYRLHQSFESLDIEDLPSLSGAS
jgi:hypothetical protein